MATIHPSKVPQDCPDSELKVRGRFVTGVADEVVILHSVVWQSRRGKRQGDGEADFVVLVPGRGILILEVKGGGIEVRNGVWYSRDRHSVVHEIKDPFQQAKDSKYALLAYLGDVDASLARIPIVHGVVFPDISVGAPLAPNAPRGIVIDRADLDGLSGAIERIFDHWETRHALAKREIDRLVGKLAPTRQVRRLLADEVGDVNQGLIELTDEQIGVLQSLRRIRRAVIFGGAGTGKTLLAVEKARQLAEAGFKTLLVCFNVPLRRHLAELLSGLDVDVAGFHELTYRELRLAGIPFPGNPFVPATDADLAGALLDAASTNGTRYDAIVVDEGQDFSGDWLSTLQLLIDDGGVFYVFADSHQDLYRRDWELSKDLVEYELTKNCRNSRPIAGKVAAVFDDRLDDRAIDGPKPKFIEFKRPSQIVPAVQDLLQELVGDEGIRRDQVIVLSDSKSIVEELRTTGIAECVFTDLDGDGIAVETVHRFKGLERDVVVVVLTGKRPAEETRALAYVGLSRARAGLYVVSTALTRTTTAWDTR